MYIFTIIIPHYNIPHKLSRLLASIPVRDDLQVIVVDDCSPDVNSLKKVKSTFPFVEFYTTDLNGGGGKARNIGLKYAMGKYLIFADSDDYFLPNFGLLLDRFSNNDINYDIIFYNAISLYEDTREKSHRVDHLHYMIDKYLNMEKKADLLLRFCFGEPWCKIVNRKVVDDFHIKFDEIPIHNDTKFSYLVGFYAHDIMVCSDVVYCVTDSPYSVSKSIKWDAMNIRANVFSEKYKYLYEHSVNVFDSLTFTPIFVSMINLKLDRLKEIVKIYNSFGIKNRIILIKSIQSLSYYFCHKFYKLKSVFNGNICKRLK